MSPLRAVAPLKMPDVKPAEISSVPQLTWLPLDRLVINEDYQRSLTERSVSAIRRIVAKFDWARLKALTVVEMEDGTYEIIDGQHTAIAAASHGGIERLPCLVSPERSLQARASDFVGINRDRVSMTAQQVFWAEVTAEDELAIEALQGASAGGGTIRRGPPSYGAYDIGDIMCPGALKAIAKRGGPTWVKRVVSICVDGKLAPIKAPFVAALPRLLWEGPLAGTISDGAIVSVLRIHGGETLITQARTLRKRLRITTPIALATTIKEHAE